MRSKMFTLSVLISVCFTLKGIVEAQDWSYGSVDSWSTDFKDCGLQSQSPVAILTKDALHKEALDGGFQFGSGMESNIINGSLFNNGHSFEFKVIDSPMLTMRGAGLSYSDYELLQFHFHFGTVNTMGSEHTIDGKQYPAEVHFVFKSASAPGNDERQYAVLGFFIDIEKDAHYTHGGPLGIMFEKIATLTTTGDEVLLEDGFGVFNIIPLFDPSIMKKFYHYQGSFTTPPCSEIVQWFVFQHPIYINQNQYNNFLDGKDKNGEKFSNTFRPVKPLNRRAMYRTKLASDFNALEPSKFLTIVVLAILYTLG